MRVLKENKHSGAWGFWGYFLGFKGLEGIFPVGFVQCALVLLVLATDQVTVYSAYYVLVCERGRLRAKNEPALAKRCPL